MCDKQGLEGFHRAFVLATLSARSRKTNESEGASMVQVQIYTNDREQPIDLEVQQMRTQAYKRKRTPQRPLHRPGDQGDYKGPGYRRFGQSAIHNAGGARRGDLPQHGESRRGNHLLGQRA